MPVNALWEYTLAVYDKPGVKSVLLQLQDGFGADINMLLSCCWLAEHGRALNDEDLSALIQSSAEWRAKCIIPLRTVRRFLKSQQWAESIYEQLKTLEIDAEQWQQNQMYVWLSTVDLPASQRPAGEIALQNLQRYGMHLSGVEWSDAAGLLGELVSVAGLKS